MADNTHNILRDLVSNAKCKPDWSFRIKNDDGALFLIIRIECQNSYPPHEPRLIDHYHPVPIATYNRKSWQRWMFEQCRRTENHELGEWLRWGEERPFAPLHGPGEDPYTVHEYRDEIDARTTQDGSVRD